jgi:dephospho-CoA kinase
MSATGKSTVIAALAKRGYKTVDTDYDGWIEEVDLPAGGREVLWQEERMSALLSAEDSEVLFVSGTARNQVRFYPRFDLIVLLSVPAPVTAERLAARTNNPYGKRPGELAQVLELKRTVEPALRRAAHLEIDTSGPIDGVVAKILRAIAPE